MRFDPLNLLNLQLWIEDQPATLAHKEAMLLEVLLRASPGLVVRNRLEQAMYASHEAVLPNALEAIVSRLHKRLGSGVGKVRIDTVCGVGYRIALNEHPIGSVARG